MKSITTTPISAIFLTFDFTRLPGKFFLVCHPKPHSKIIATDQVNLILSSFLESDGKNYRSTI
jgi:hypothetical protein